MFSFSTTIEKEKPNMSYVLHHTFLGMFLGCNPGKDDGMEFHWENCNPLFVGCIPAAPTKRSIANLVHYVVVNSGVKDFLEITELETANRGWATIEECRKAGFTLQLQQELKS